jgi:hypothetical protein
VPILQLFALTGWCSRGHGDRRSAGGYVAGLIGMFAFAAFWPDRVGPTIRRMGPTPDLVASLFWTPFSPVCGTDAPTCQSDGADRLLLPLAVTGVALIAEFVTRRTMRRRRGVDLGWCVLRRCCCTAD